MIFVARGAFCQKIDKKDNKIQPFGLTQKPTNQLFTLSKGSSLKPVMSFLVTPNFYVTQLGFFCKQEIKLEKITKLPFKFRLGSVQYCDWMEGKINTGVLPNY